LKQGPGMVPIELIGFRIGKVVWPQGNGAFPAKLDFTTGGDGPAPVLTDEYGGIEVDIVHWVGVGLGRSLGRMGTSDPEPIVFPTDVLGKVEFEIKIELGIPVRYLGQFTG